MTRGNWGGDLPLMIRDLVTADQEQIKMLILDGLEDHFGVIKPGLNPDLDDLSGFYGKEIFLVATEGSRPIGCGAVVRHSPTRGEIVRVSVRRNARRQGIGSLILEALCEKARNAGIQQLVLETTASWEDVRSFYERFGFTYTHFVADEYGGQAHYELFL